MRGYTEPQAAAEHAAEHKAQALPQPDRIRALHGAHGAAAPSCRLAHVRFGRPIRARPVQELRPGRAHRRVRSPDALPHHPRRRDDRSGKVRAEVEGASRRRGSDTADPGQLPTYNAYSAAGDVTAPLVYVNYGVPEDYDYLAKQGIDVKGKIVIARYGGSWRGIKPKVAAEHGAVGCIIYSDPRDDGYYQGDVYPKGALRPPDGVQRGSVMDMPVAVGDPLSPGWASEKGSRRLTRAEAKTLMKIPVLPISYADATPLLRTLEGPVAPEGWRGALGFTYHIGPGPATVHLKLDFDWSTRPLHDVIATIPGSEFPDEWVVYGNHHDAWVNGAHDPFSGAARLLESARALGELYKQGWQPEAHHHVRALGWRRVRPARLHRMGREARRRAGQKSGRLYQLRYQCSRNAWRQRLAYAGAFHDRSAARPEGSRSPARRCWKPRARAAAIAADRRRHRRILPSPPEFHLGALGAGSDYVAFIDHIGVASLNFGFGGANQGGVYHSIYDDMTGSSASAIPISFTARRCRR